MSIGVDVNWKKIVAKEWIWFICTTLGVLLFLNLILFIASEANIFEDFWEPLFNTRNRDHDSVLLVTILPIGIVYFIRFTVCAVKQLRKKEVGNK